MKQYCAFARLVSVFGMFLAVFAVGQPAGAQTCTPTGSPYTCTAFGSLNIDDNLGSSSSSTVTVSGVAGNPVVSSLTVNLTGMLSFAPESLQSTIIWLEAPNGTNYVLLGMTGSSQDDLTGLNITLSDNAGSFAPIGPPDSWPLTGSTTVKPSSYVNAIFEPDNPSTDTAIFWSDVPAGTLFPSGDSVVSPYLDGSTTLLEAFGSGAGSGAAPVNGTWTLHLANVVKYGEGSAVTIGGWALNFTYAASSNDQTSTSVSSSINPVVIGASVRYTATVNDTPNPATKPSGTVTFTASPSGGGAAVTLCSGVTVSNGTAQCTVTNASSLGEGLSTVTASFTPAAGFSTSTGSTPQLVERNAVNTTGNTWCNQGGISIPNNSQPQAYPSIIKVQGYAAGTTVATATVSINGLSASTAAQPGAFLLVAPNGQNLDLLDRAFSNFTTFSNINLTLEDDAGTSPATVSPSSGSYFPYVNSGGTLTVYPSSSAPAIDGAIPQVPATLNYPVAFGSSLHTLANELNGAPANGDWALYITGTSAQTLSGGWCLNLTPNTGVGTATAVTSTQNPAAPGQSVTYTAAVTSLGSPVTTGGTVTFLDNGLTPGGTVSGNNVQSLGATGTAAFASSALVNQVLTDSGTVSIKEGDHLISANYGGNADDNPSEGTLVERIDNAPVTPTWSSPNNYSVCNATPSIPGPIYSNQGVAGAFTPNPSNIFVKNLPGTVSSVSLTLKSLSESHAGVMDQVESLVEGPTGAALDFFSHAGYANNSGNTVSAGDYTFIDTAPSAVPSSGAMAPGSYRPTSYLAGDTFISSACTSSTCLSSGTGYKVPTSFSYSAPEGTASFGGAFGSTNPNGTWSLFFNVTGPVNAVNIPGGWCLNFVENPVAVAVNVGHSGAGTGTDFAQGEQGAQITATITNEGTGPTGDPSGGNPLTVTDTLNATLTYAGFAGSGWSCSASGQSVTCTNDSPVAAGSAYPALTINVNVSKSASGTFTNTVNVSGAGTTSNSGSDTVVIDSAPVLVLSNGTTSITDSGNFKQGGTGQWFVPVANIAANGRTAEQITVVDTLPPGYTLVSSASSGAAAWNCGGVGVTVTCTTSDSISAGGYSTITLIVNIPANSPVSVTDTAVVFGGGDLVHTSLATGTTASETATVAQVPSGIAVSSGNNQSVVIDQAFASPLVVTVTDAGNLPIAGQNVTFSVVPGLNGQSGTFLTGATFSATTNGSGQATANITANGKAGQFTVLAVAGSVSTSFTLTNLVGGPANLSVSAGSPQSAVLGAPFAVPLTVLVTDSGLNPVSGVAVSFTAPSSGPTATLSASSCITDVTGSCSVTAMAAGATGAYNVSATAVGFSANFALTNNPVPSYVVTVNTDLTAGTAANCVDQNVGGGDNSNCSLRDALAAAANGGGGNITFNSTAFASAQTIPLTNGTLTLPSNTAIQGRTTGSGATLTNLVTVDGGNTTRVFNVASGVTAEIDNLIVAHGANPGSVSPIGGSGGNGGGISNAGTLRVTNSTFTNNSNNGGSNTTTAGSGGLGGGIYNSGTLTVTASTFTNNSNNGGSSQLSGGAGGQGGGIYNSGTLTVTTSTFTNNSNNGGNGSDAALGLGGAGGLGGAIYSTGTLTLINSTFTNNSNPGGSGTNANGAGGQGGGIYISSGTAVLVNTIVSGNSNGDVFGYTDPGNSGNVIGSSGVNLAPLSIAYGGPTQTMIPLPGSTAICAGTATPTGVMLSSTDQRGYPGQNTSYPGYSADTPCVDSGAVQTNYALAWTKQPGLVVEAGVPFPAAVTLHESGLPLNGATIPLTVTGIGSITSGGSATTGSNGVASYSLVVPANTKGTLTTTIVPSHPVNSKSFSATSQNPFGYLDTARDATSGSQNVMTADSLHVSGWAADLAAGTQAASVQVYVDGQAFGSPVVPSLARSDVASVMGAGYGNVGWIATGSAASLSVGAHTVTAVAMASGGGTGQLLGSIVIHVVSSTALPFGYLDEAQDATTHSATISSGDSLHISGWAADASTLAPAPLVTVYIDGVAAGMAVPSIARPDVAAARGAGYLKSGWVLMLSPEQVAALGAGQHTVTAVATAANGLTQPLTASLKISVAVEPAVRRPTGPLQNRRGVVLRAPEKP